jgi:hypothetical protein
MTSSRSAADQSRALAACWTAHRRVDLQGDNGPPATYYPSMDSSSPSAAECASEVTAALAPRALEMSADIYQLIVREIPQLRSDKRILQLLEASVGENVATVLHILQHSIDLENVHTPAAAEEYARRLAQRGVPIAALLRAYRVGSARFEDWCLQELGRRTDNAAVVSTAGLRIATVLASYIDKVSEEVVSAYESEKENWLRNQSVARAARVRALLRNEPVDVDSFEAILGYRLRQRHLGSWRGRPRRQAEIRSDGWSMRPRKWRPGSVATGGRRSSRRTNSARGPGCRSVSGATLPSRPWASRTSRSPTGSGSLSGHPRSESWVSAALTSKR